MGIDHNDYFGNLIKRGDLVVWPNRQGSSMWMNHGYVTALGFDVGTGMPVRHDPILQVKRVQTTALINEPTGKFRNVTLTDLSRVIALGRVKHFVPRKDKILVSILNPEAKCRVEAHEIATKDVVEHIKPNLIDKIMRWFRGLS